MNQLGTVSFLSFRARMLGRGDPGVTKIAYIHARGFARIDAGRAWISEPLPKGRSALALVDPLAPVPSASALRSMLLGATTVRVIGPTVVGGVRTTGFLATTVDRATLPKLVKALPSITARVYLAADGLLVRSVTRFGATTFTATASTTPTVDLRPPPGDQTSDYRTLTPGQRRAVQRAFGG